MKIGFIGFGEAAYNISYGLGKEGISGIVAYDALMNDEAMGTQVHIRAEQAGVVLLDSAAAVASTVEIVFAAVPSSFTLNVFEEIRGVLREGQLYVDVSASTPAVKEQIGAALDGSGVLFVDAAMLGSLPKDQHRVPIAASGSGAAMFYEKLTPFGMQIETAGESAGAASAIKLVRSIFMKGIASLMIETMQAADAYGVSKEVEDSLGTSMDGISFSSHLERLVSGSALHCERRAAELKGSISMLEETGLSAEMTVATQHRLEALVPYQFAKQYAGKKSPTWQEIIAALRVSESAQ